MQYSAKLVKQATGTGDNRSHSEANVHSSKGVMESSSIYRGCGDQSSYGAPAAGLIRGACGASGRGFSRTRRNSAPSLTADPWRPSDGRWVVEIKVFQCGVVSKVRPGDPTAVFWSVTHPVYQVLKTSPVPSDIHNFVDLPS